MESEITPAMEESVQRGLRYLSGIQNDDGSFGRGQFAKHAGITALCGLAFMADGHLPGRGAYGDNVRKALEFVLSSATETGLLASEKQSRSNVWTWIRHSFFGRNLWNEQRGRPCSRRPDSRRRTDH